jgi:hypothetical protein
MIDLQELARELHAMKPRQPLHELIKAEMKRRGRWKAKPRGKPMEKGHDPRRDGA